MRYGIAVPNFDRFANKDSILKISIAAEELGFVSLWVSDHLVIPEFNYGSYN
ncbi:MAG: hypothetical protein ACR2NW_07535 [Thermodesulfobacteriota bacterium]